LLCWQLAHPVLNTLKATPNAWLVELLFAFNTGDIAKFEKMKPQWETVPDLAAQEIKLRQKISLLCLMEVTNCVPLTTDNYSMAAFFA
jgi:26S proteasome regulatory subunit N9